MASKPDEKRISVVRFLLRSIWFGGGAFLVVMLDLRVAGRSTADWLLPSLSFAGLGVAVAGLVELRHRRKREKDISSS
ncbi:hypothetical protein AB0M95_29245 [Sphaerisporangium sp. NPDC051017]|uniref:hypothetical protein n=1 Tax=Sphaerisporangium sp. NPDC051017 TaxID=3154636 RepID=UPI00343D37D4